MIFLYDKNECVSSLKFLIYKIQDLPEYSNSKLADLNGNIRLKGVERQHLSLSNGHGPEELSVSPLNDLEKQLVSLRN